MFHLTAFIQNIARLSKKKDNVEICYQTNDDYGFWGNIKDTKNSEFYIQNNPYIDIPPDQYGYWGLYKDDYSNVNYHQNYVYNVNTSNNYYLKNKIDNATGQNRHSFNNLLDVINTNKGRLNGLSRHNNSSQLSKKKFDYKYKVTIETVKCDKTTCRSSFENDLFDEELIYSLKLKSTCESADIDDNLVIKKVNFLHLSNSFYESNEENDILNNLLNLTKPFELITKKYNPIKLYSGDIVSTKKNSNYELEKSFNQLKFHAAMYGINDLYKNMNSLQTLENFLHRTNSIWLISNLFDVKKQYLPITKCNIMMIIDWKSIKIGFMGLMHLNTSSASNNNVINNHHHNHNQFSNIKYVDYLNEANRLSYELEKRGANLIIALTQMNYLHDEYLATNARHIDIIFSTAYDNDSISNAAKTTSNNNNNNTSNNGDYDIRNINNRLIIKTNSKNNHLSLVELSYNDTIQQITSIDVRKIKLKDNCN